MFVWLRAPLDQVPPSRGGGRIPLGLCLNFLALNLLALNSAGCSGSTGEQAAIGAGVAVAATGIHRAATGDCWGRCSPGYVCNQKSGFCEPGECSPSCPEGYSCITEPTGNRCEPSANPTFNPVDGTIRVEPRDEKDNPNPDTDPPPRSAPALTPARSESGRVQIPRGNPGPVGGEAVTAEPAKVPEPGSSACSPDSSEEPPVNEAGEKSKNDTQRCQEKSPTASPGSPSPEGDDSTED